METHIDIQDYIDVLILQRNEALNAAAQTNAALKGAQKRIAALEEAAKSEPKAE